MKILFLIMAIFVSELALSYLSDMRNVYVVSRKRWWATSFDLGASLLGWFILLVIIYSREIIYLIPAIIGSALGTYWAANRKVKRKKPRKKIPVTTA